MGRQLQDRTVQHVQATWTASTATVFLKSITEVLFIHFAHTPILEIVCFHLFPPLIYLAQPFNCIYLFGRVGHDFL